MKIKLIICDFDGTITKEDVLDNLCAVVGKKAESQSINQNYIQNRIDGKEALMKRFSLLQGLALSDIEKTLSKIELTDGAPELFTYAKEHGIKTVLISGNASFVLDYFKNRLKISDAIGSTLNTDGGIIHPWDHTKCACIDKQSAALKFIRELGVSRDETIAIGDSIADKTLFELAGTTFLINKKGNITADYEIKTLHEVITYLNNHENTLQKIPRIIFNFNDKCLNGCPFCFIPFDHKGAGSLSLWKEILDRITELSPDMLSFSGCDPFYYDDFYTLLETKKKHCYWGVDTSLIWLDKDRFDACYQKLDQISTSWDDVPQMAVKQRYSAKKADHFIENFEYVLSRMPNIVVHTLYSKFNAAHHQAIADELISRKVKTWSLYQFWPFDFIKSSEPYLVEKEVFCAHGEKLLSYINNRLDFEYVPYDNRANGYFFVSSTGNVFTTATTNGIGSYKQLGTIFDKDIFDKWKFFSNPKRADEILKKKIKREF